MKVISHAGMLFKDRGTMQRAITLYYLISKERGKFTSPLKELLDTANETCKEIDSPIIDDETIERERANHVSEFTGKEFNPHGWTFEIKRPPIKLPEVKDLLDIARTACSR